MNSRQIGIAVLLAGALAFCLPFDLSAQPKASAAAQPAPAETAQQSEVQALQARVRELGEIQTRLLKQVEEQAQLLEQVKRASNMRPITAPGTLSVVESADELPLPPETPGYSRLGWMLGGAAAFACALCIILLLRIRQPETAPAPRAAPTETDAPALALSLEAETVTPSQVHPMLPALPDWDPASPALDVQAAEVFAPEDKTQAHDSTIELAEIMLSFGRINSAAEALASFIDSNPKAAVAPWLKLLEVYRESGQRAEFDKTARKLNKTFNARAVDWDNFVESRNPAHGLEEMSHITQRLQQLWGTRECQAYLQYLLRDNRDETRRGFSLTAIDDILCLNAILEYDLGPYTGPLEAFSSNEPEENAPLTEIDKKLRKADETTTEQEEADEPPTADLLQKNEENAPPTEIDEKTRKADETTTEQEEANEPPTADLLQKNEENAPLTEIDEKTREADETTTEQKEADEPPTADLLQKNTAPETPARIDD
ncbi:MAG: hypothetical protein LBR95_01165 [Azoarcus sp.]|nr:hypothetical protein [Azoarcus sp.]